MAHVLRPATLAVASALAVAVMGVEARSAPALSASPVCGSAPLEVTFTGEGSGMLEGIMLLDFGDGETDSTISTIRGFTRTHIYQSPGTYKAVLKSGTNGGQHAPTLTDVKSVEIVVK